VGVSQWGRGSARNRDVAHVPGGRNGGFLCQQQEATEDEANHPYRQEEPPSAAFLLTRCGRESGQRRTRRQPAAPVSPAPTTIRATRTEVVSWDVRAWPPDPALTPLGVAEDS